MLHEMTLFPKPYTSIASGQKTIELRLYDEKRQSIQIGDQIRFTNTEDESQTTLCEVVQLHVFKNFAELYESLPLLKCGYTPEDVVNAHPDDMLTYYSKETYIIQSTIPTLVIMPILAAEAKGDVDFATNVVTMTTIAYLAVLPLWSLFLFFI